MRWNLLHFNTKDDIYPSEQTLMFSEQTVVVLSKFMRKKYLIFKKLSLFMIWFGIYS